MSDVLQPYAELPTGTAIRHALKWQVIGLILLAYHAFLVKQSLAFVVAMPILLAILYTNAPLAGLLVYFQFLIYQNVVIALAAVGMPAFNFTVLLGTNFLAITLMAGGWRGPAVPATMAASDQTDDVRHHPRRAAGRMLCGSGCRPCGTHVRGRLFS
jgi:hypothetical protein